MDPRRVDTQKVQATQLRLLFHTYLEVPRWYPELTERLGTDGEDVWKRFGELRTFFVVVSIAWRGSELSPEEVPYEPPPLLADLWRAMAQNPFEYERFCTAIGVPDYLRFTTDHPAERRITPRKACLLLNFAEQIGLTPDRNLWRIG